ncbi:hypothetical protein C8R46DRAFT_1027012 [Mycena filopes]|nr:hypothetical protein C8R46DRAFT_1027012 [Mycena filopes]
MPPPSVSPIWDARMTAVRTRPLYPIFVPPRPSHESDSSTPPRRRVRPSLPEPPFFVLISYCLAARYSHDPTIARARGTHWHAGNALSEMKGVRDDVRFIHRSKGRATAVPCPARGPRASISRSTEWSTVPGADASYARLDCPRPSSAFIRKGHAPPSPLSTATTVRPVAGVGFISTSASRTFMHSLRFIVFDGSTTVREKRAPTSFISAESKAYTPSWTHTASSFGPYKVFEFDWLGSFEPDARHTPDVLPILPRSFGRPTHSLLVHRFHYPPTPGPASISPMRRCEVPRRGGRIWLPTVAL